MRSNASFNWLSRWRFQGITMVMPVLMRHVKALRPVIPLGNLIAADHAIFRGITINFLSGLNRQMPPHRRKQGWYGVRLT